MLGMWPKEKILRINGRWPDFREERSTINERGAKRKKRKYAQPLNTSSRITMSTIAFACSFSSAGFKETATSRELLLPASKKRWSWRKQREIATGSRLRRPPSVV